MSAGLGMGEPPKKASAQNETLVRIAAGTVLAAVALVAILAGPGWFTVFLTMAAMVMAWEWGRIVRSDRAQPRQFLLMLHGASVMAIGLSLLFALYTIAAFIALAMAILLLLAGRPGGLDWWSGTGALYTSLPLMAMVWMRSDAAYGIWAVLFVIISVAATDTAAYFSGRTFGGAKFAPRISPNKTWSGFIGGVTMAGVAAYLFAVALELPSAGILGGIGIVLGAVSQLGDLFESFVKRRFGVKDASNIIPGHGGVMDRADGLIFAALLAAMISLLRGAEMPGAGLLVW